MRLAIVGTGPTGIYSFRHLMAGPLPLEIALFEQGPVLGIGLPYAPETASRQMLANIASIEIPPIGESYLDWLMARPDAELATYGLDRGALDARSFTPRLLLGQYFRDALDGLIAQARARGVIVHGCPDTRVTDLRRVPEGLQLITDPALPAQYFDKVILATGHVFEEDPDLTDHYFPNPWSGLLQVDIPATEVAVLGTSLSGIDAAMAVACQHGTFRGRGEDLRFELSKDSADLRITLMSWTGLLPEADFYCPLPYEPLTIATEEALAEAARGPEVLDRVFALMRAEITAADPDWSAKIGLEGLDPEAFHNAYFADRMAHDPFDWAAKNLAEVVHNKAEKITVGWRYAILRLHEAVETVVPALSEAEAEIFNETLKKVFVDNYAAVPEESIRRLLALHRAGVVTTLALGEDYDMVHEEDRTVVTAKGQRHIFHIFIDARGQKAMQSKDLPFPALREALLAAGQDTPEIGQDYGLRGVPGYSAHLYLAALPYLMQDQPFVQGITACADIGRTIAVAEGAARRRRARL